VRSGVDQQELSGEGALLDNEHVAAVANRLGADRQNFLDNLSLLVRTSKAKDFQNVDLVDTVRRQRLRMCAGGAGDCVAHLERFAQRVVC